MTQLISLLVTGLGILGLCILAQSLKRKDRCDGTCDRDRGGRHSSLD